MESIEPISFPTQHVIEAPTSGAGFAIRAGARILDIIILQALGLFTGFAIGLLIGLALAIMGIDSTLAQKMGTPSLFSIAFALIGHILYSTICETICGASIGKLTFGLQVVTDKGDSISFKAALIRSLAYFIDSILFGGIAYMSMSQSKLNQRYGDQWAYTIVVKRSQLADAQIPAWWKFILAFAIACSIYVALLSLSLVIKLF